MSGVGGSGDSRRATLTGDVAGASGQGGSDDSEKQTTSECSAKRERLRRTKSMEMVDEEGERTAVTDAAAGSSPGKVRGCADYFGVKSYLHNFYETHVYKDPDIYEDDAGRYLLSPAGARRHRCVAAAVWWKVFVWIGVNFLAFGVVGVLVGYLVPQRSIFAGAIAHNVEVVDRAAVAFNFNLDVCKIVGLVLFCVGGLTLTVALVFPSFLDQYCGEDQTKLDGGSFKVRIDNDTPAPTCPMELSVPATGKISTVQPERRDETMTSSGDAVSYHD